MSMLRRAALALVLLCSTAWAGPFIWTGADDGTTWEDPANWNPSDGGFPGQNAGEGAVIDGGTPTASGSIALGSLSMLGGTLSASVFAIDDGTEHGQFLWSGGTVDVSILQIASGATWALYNGPLTLSGSVSSYGSVYWLDASLEGESVNFVNYGSFEWSSSDPLSGTGNTFYNMPGGTLLVDPYVAAPEFPAGWSFLTESTITNEGGPLRLSDPSYVGVGTGTNLTAGKMIIASANAFFEPEVADVIVLDAGATLTVDPSSVITFDGVPFPSGTLHLEGGGTFEWQGTIATGVVGQTFQIESDSHLLIDGPGPIALIGGAIGTNAGTGAWLDDGELSLENGSILVNAGTLEIRGNGVMDSADSGVGPLVNEGTLFKRGDGGATRIEDELDNFGTVSLESGSLAFDQAASATFIQDAGALVLDGGWLAAYDSASSIRQPIWLYSGVLSGSGTLDAVLWSAATIKPGGDNVGTIVLGGFQQTADGQLIIDWVDAGYDRVLVDGGAMLDGTLQVDAGDTPPGGAVATVMTFAAASGSFATVMTEGLPLVSSQEAQAFVLEMDAGISLADAGADAGSSVDAGSDGGSVTDGGPSGSHSDGGGSSTTGSGGGCACNASGGAFSWLAVSLILVGLGRRGSKGAARQERLGDRDN